MPEYNAIRGIVEELLGQGIDDRDEIVRAASGRIEVDEDELRRVYFTKAVSWAISQVRDDLGKRLVYQIREGGKHYAVHVGTTANYQLVRKISNHKLRLAEALRAEGDRLAMIAEQIEIDFGRAA